MILMTTRPGEGEDLEKLSPQLVLLNHDPFALRPCKMCVYSDTFVTEQC